MPAILDSAAISLDRPHHHMRYPDRDLLIAAGTPIYLDRPRTSDPADLIVVAVDTRLHLITAERRRARHFAARWISAAAHDMDSMGTGDGLEQSEFG
jgi:hypothetical protein